MEEKKFLWNIVHEYDVDGGFGDAICKEARIATVYATTEEIKAFIAKYDKPYEYDHPYAALYCHGVRADEITPVDISELDEEEIEDELHSPDWNWWHKEENDEDI